MSILSTDYNSSILKGWSIVVVDHSILNLWNRMTDQKLWRICNHWNSILEWTYHTFFDDRCRLFRSIVCRKRRRRVEKIKKRKFRGGPMRFIFHFFHCTYNPLNIIIINITLMLSLFNLKKSAVRQKNPVGGVGYLDMENLRFKSFDTEWQLTVRNKERMIEWVSEEKKEEDIWKMAALQTSLITPSFSSRTYSNEGDILFLQF